jgi:hypothetical protein
MTGIGGKISPSSAESWRDLMMGVATSPGSNWSSRRFLACGLRADLTLDQWIILRVSSVRILKVMACLTDSLIPTKCPRFSRERKVTVIKLVVDRFPEVKT